MFKIGQKVVCIDDSGSNLLKRNHVYTISRLSECDGCGVKLLYLSEFDDMGMGYISVCGCGNEYRHELLWRTVRFRPLQYDIISNKEILKNLIDEKLDIQKEETVEILG